MEHTLRGRGRDGRTYVLLIIEKYINNIDGTDGHRCLCRQFYTSSNYLLQPSLASFKPSFQKSRHLLSLKRSEGQGRKTSPTALQKISGRRCGSRVVENHESYRKVAAEYGVSHETIRRLVRAAHCLSMARLRTDGTRSQH